MNKKDATIIQSIYMFHKTKNQHYEIGYYHRRQ